MCHLTGPRIRRTLPLITLRRCSSVDGASACTKESTSSQLVSASLSRPCSLPQRSPSSVGREFERAVQSYGLLPAHIASVVAVALPPSELIAGVLLVVGLATAVVAAFLGALLGVFAFAVAFNLFRGRRIDCGCFGHGIPQRITWRHVLRNLALGTMAAFVVASAPRAFALDSLLFGPVEGPAHSAGLAVGLTAIGALVAATMLADVGRLRRQLRRGREVPA